MSRLLNWLPDRVADGEIELAGKRGLSMIDLPESLNARIKLTARSY
jgi:hypothetical protein